MTDPFIGIGERWALNILKQLTNLEEIKDLEEWGKPGIYTQVPMKNLILMKLYQALSFEHRRSSADIVVISKDYKIIVVRIQGKGHGEGWHKGNGKNQFDSVQEFYLKESNCIVINLTRWNSPGLLNEKNLEDAKKEILYAFESIGLNDLVCYAI